MDYIKLTEVCLPAIVSGIVGGCTVWIGHRQISAMLQSARMSYRAQIATTTQREWLTELRTNLAAAITECRMMQMAAKNQATSHIVDIKQLVQSVTKVQLLLDPQDPLLNDLALPKIGIDFDWKNQAHSNQVINSLIQIGVALQKRENAQAKL